jgi:acetate---CoA ligase (ADP-forming)
MSSAQSLLQSFYEKLKKKSSIDTVIPTQADTQTQDYSSKHSKLDQLLSPKSIAVIGASATEKKLGAIILRNIIQSGFPGEVIPLNPKESEIQGLKCYADYADLPFAPDLAIIAIPSTAVLEVLEKIGQKGTKNVVVLTAGFKEIGGEGVKLESDLVEIAQKYEINVLGPNCLGFINNNVPLNATFSQSQANKSHLRFISQSGAIASSIFDWTDYSEVGFTEFITLGNKAVINENDALEHFLENPLNFEKNEGESAYQPIGMYLESINDGRRFVKLCQKISQKDPIFILKPGKSEESKQAMQSHTGAIAGEDYVFEAAVKKANVIRCEGIEDFFDMARVFSWEEAPKGKNIAVISNAGGPAVMTSDFVAESGLQLVQFDQETKEKLAQALPSQVSVINPIDLIGDALADRYQIAVETVIQNDEVDALIVILTPQVMTQIEETATAIGKLSLQYGKTVVCSFMGGSLISDGEKILNKYKIPSFRYPERAVKALASMYFWNLSKGEIFDTAENVNLPIPNVANEIFTKVNSSNRKTFDNFEANQLLDSYGIKTPATASVTNVDEALNFANQHQYPVVLKISSPKNLHKVDVGGVILGIKDDEQLRNEFSNISQILETLEEKTAQDSIQIQKQVDKGVEVLVGLKKDLNFGHTLMFGAGGTLANLLEDRNLGLLPLSREELRKLVVKSKIYKLLSGYRGGEVYDINMILDFLMKFQQLALNHPEIKEMDINPAIITTNEIWAVDGKVIL